MEYDKDGNKQSSPIERVELGEGIATSPQIAVPNVMTNVAGSPTQTDADGNPITDGSGDGPGLTKKTKVPTDPARIIYWRER